MSGRRVSVAVVGAAVTLLIATAPQSSAAPSGTGASAAPAAAAAATTYPPRVTMITDSVGGVLFWVTSQRDRLAQGLDFRLETKTCRLLVSPGCFAYGEIPPSALDTVTTLGPELGHLVVIDVGYNDLAAGYAGNLDTVMRALIAAGVERVVWVTLSEGQSNWVEINDQIRAAPLRWPQLVVAEWAPVAARNPAWFADGPHMNQLGAEGFVDFLRPILLGACGSECIPPATAATIAALIVRSGRVTLRWRGNTEARTYDVAVRRSGGTWRILVTRLAATRYGVRGLPGTHMQARVRARNESDVPGAWSQPRAFRF